MLRSKANNDVLFEHRFWIQILGDHLRFFKLTLSRKEKDILYQVRNLIEKGDALQNDADVNKVVLADVLDFVEQVKELKKMILALLLKSEIEINLPPTFINHMLNELEEYERILNANEYSGKIQANIWDAHYLWLSDAAGHAASLLQTIDPIEKLKMKEILKSHKIFDKLFHKSIECIGYTRSELTNFAALDRLTEEAVEEMMVFVNILTNLKEERIDASILGILNPLMVDHMIREECYY